MCPDHGRDEWLEKARRGRKRKRKGRHLTAEQSALLVGIRQVYATRIPDSIEPLLQACPHLRR